GVRAGCGAGAWAWAWWGAGAWAWAWWGAGVRLLVTFGPWRGPLPAARYFFGFVAAVVVLWRW
ncbi:MAG TPA: hypothetical protein VMR14_15655, partial [Streptosporangiaceae bacterium]|nr:hypothetical protein [Streptosporangiaceae bacterium]